jgi:hypothetical protein
MTLCSIWACRLRFAHAAGHGSGLPLGRTAMIIRCVPFVFPFVFQPGKGSGSRRELISCCERGLFVLDDMIREYPNVN